jgi:hypothetical protein
MRIAELRQVRLELAAIPLAGPLTPLYVDRQGNDEVSRDGRRQSIAEESLVFELLDHTAREKVVHRSLGAVWRTIDRNRLECGDFGLRHSLAWMFGHCSPHLNDFEGGRAAASLVDATEYSGERARIQTKSILSK